MATIKQARFVSKLVENGRAKVPLSKGELLRQSGYSEALQIKPSVIERSKGVQELLAKVENAGLNDQYLLDKLKKVVDSRDSNAVFNVVKWIMSVKYPEANPYFKKQTINNTQINISSVEEGAYLFLQDKYQLSKEEIIKRLSK